MLTNIDDPLNLNFLGFLERPEWSRKCVERLEKWSRKCVYTMVKWSRKCAGGLTVYSQKDRICLRYSE
jgi:hypothetical protein